MYHRKLVYCLANESLRSRRGTKIRLGRVYQNRNSINSVGDHVVNAMHHEKSATHSPHANR